MTALEAVRGVARELEAAGVPSPRVDAEHIVAHVLELSRSGVYSSSDPLSERQGVHLRSLVERRRAREPLAYILGEWGFRRLTLSVDLRALVPRPETELVVERCLWHLRGLEAPQVLDVGVGSGAIALSLADEHPGARIVGIDSSEGALALAGENLATRDVNGRVVLCRGDLLSGFRGPYDLVVSNPPYVEPSDLQKLMPDVRDYEPHVALVGENVTEEVALAARDVLRPGGWLVLEVADGQAPSVRGRLEELGYGETEITPDLTGRERVVEGAV